MVLFLFFCSGATGLIYEVIWSKHLSLMFGSTIRAQTVVLAVFMGGLALGNHIIGTRSDLLRRPLAGYGYMEIAIGIFAFLFGPLYALADGIFVSTGAGILSQPLLLLLLKGVLSVCLLIVPTILMGGTLPLLAAWLQKSSVEAGRRSARFYSVNSLGAVAGSFLAGFFLAQWIGLEATLQMTGLVNLIIGGTALLVSRRIERPDEPSPASTFAGGSSSQVQPMLRRGCWMVALSGGVSLGLEVLAARGLSLIFGASLQAFAIVLMAFILGIGVGASIIASPRWKRWRNETVIFTVLILTAAWICLFIFNIEQGVNAFRVLKSGLASNETGFRYYQFLAGVISLIVLGVPAGLLGTVLPLWIRIVSKSDSHLGKDVGRLLTWNTCGAVAGVLFTGFVLMPVVGLRGALGTMAGIISLIAAVVALGNKNTFQIALATLCAVVGLAAGFTGGDAWRYVLTSGVFRFREKEVNFGLMAARRQTYEILFHEDAPDATVSVERERKATNRFSLRINGKTDASSGGDLATQYLLAHLPMAIRPGSKDVFVLGFGSGTTAGALLGHPVDKLVVAENCEPVLRASKYFEPWNHGVLTNHRARIVEEDARTVLRLDPQRYDIIISEPSNPWTAGVGSVFSRDFYSIVASRLKPGGLICQWFHIYEMNDGIVFLVLRTFGNSFPYYEIWEANEGDILLIGSTQSFASSANEYDRIFERDFPRRDLASLGILDSTGLLARQLASQRTAFAIAGPGPIQTDNFPVLEYEAPKALYLGHFVEKLFHYDERTWQWDAAPPEKRTILNSIKEETLKSVFTHYMPGNPDLQGYLNLRFRTGNPGVEWKVAGEPMPSIFAPPDRGRNPLPSAADVNVQRLSEAISLLPTADAAKGIRDIQAILKTSSFTPGFVSQVTAIAVKASLRLNDIQSANALLRLGLTANQGSEQLRYLARIMEREKVLDSASP